MVFFLSLNFLVFMILIPKLFNSQGPLFLFFQCFGSFHLFKTLMVPLVRWKEKKEERKF